MVKVYFFLLIILSVEIISMIPFKYKLLSLLSEFPQDQYNPSKFNTTNSLVLYNLYDQFQNYFFLKSNDNDDARICWDSIFNNMVVDYNFSILYFNSGHKLTEIGDSISCLDGNNTYLLTLLTYKINNESNKLEDKISLFISKEKYNLGICIWRECINFINQTLISNIDSDLKRNLNHLYNILDLEVIMKYPQIKEKTGLSFGVKIAILLFAIYFIIFVILKIIVAIILRRKKANDLETYQKKLEQQKKKDYLKMKDSDIIKEEENEDDFYNDNEEEEEDKKDKKKDKSKSKSNTKSIEQLQTITNKNEGEEDEGDENEEKEDDEEEEEDDNEDNDESKISNDSLFKKDMEQTKIKFMEKNLQLNTNYENDVDEKFAKKVKLLSNDQNSSKKGKLSNFSIYMTNLNTIFLGLIKINTITEYKNNIYTNQGLEMMTGLRTFALILVTLNISFNLFIESPAIIQVNEAFLNDFLFGGVKFSSFGIYFWIYLDGFNYTFKLMHFIKKDKTFKNFLKFSINLLPKIFQFLVIFYGIYFLQKDIGKMTVTTSILYEQYIENEYNYKCLTNPLYLLFPFINPVTSNDKMTNSYYNNCYQFSYLIINEFYCIIIFILMFYFLYKYKSKILEIIILVLVSVNILVMNFLPFLFENIKDQKLYLLKYVLVETFSLRYPNIMFNIFFIGVITGLIYCYYYFSEKDYLYISDEEQYFPFKYFKNLIHFFFKSNWMIQSLFIIFSLGIIIVDCLIYFILQSNGKPNQILFEFSPFLKIIYLYETPIIFVFISILIIFLLQDKFQINTFLGSKLFYIMEKISFSYICLIQMISLLFLSSSANHGECWSFLFFFYITCFEFAIGLLTSFIFTLVFELPAKLLTNILRGKDMQKKNKLI